MSRPIFKMLVKKNYPIWILFTAVCLLYFTILAITKQKLSQMMGSFVPGSVGSQTILEYMASIYFAMVVIMFPMVYYVFMTQKMVHRAVDNTSMSAYLSSSISRKQYIVTCIVFLLASLFVMFLIIFVVGALIMTQIEPVNMLRYAQIVITCLLCCMTVAMVSLFLSSVFAGNKFALLLIVGVPIAFVLLFILGSSAASVNAIGWIRYISPYGWSRVVDIAKGTYKLWWLVDIVYLLLISGFSILTVSLFRKKQLSI